MQDILLTIFTGVLALAVLMQTLLFFGIYKSIRQMKTWMDNMGKDLLGHTTAISSKVEEGLVAIKDIGDGLRPIKDKLVDTTDIVHRRVVDLDAFLSEATNAARLEIIRVQNTIQSATQRAEETLDQLHNSILAPINEINAISRAIRVGFNMLFRGRKGISHASVHDEEMFI